MRLTLRTLLAYLDDMLDPAEAKAIGQKVAESDAAQELIARIKQVTRRRRLTTPPSTGPGAFEPNTVAEYLDNELPHELVADIEKACLDSDVHLAEIAAVHQILTLALGQPALVPPKAKERMYGLVHGREAIRSRRAATASAGREGTEIDGQSEEDETLLLGLPLMRRGAGWVRWLVPLAAVLLLVVLVFAVWQALPGPSTPVASRTPGTEKGSAPEVTPPPPPPPVNDGAGKPTGGGEGTTTTPPAGGGTTPGGTPPTAPTGGTEGGTTTPPPPPPTSPAAPTTPTRPGPPSPDRRPIGQLVTQAGAPPAVLVSRPEPSKPWQRLGVTSKVFSKDNLVSLPGYRSELRLDSGVQVTLWGNLPEFVGFPFYESAATMHVPADSFDADLTFDHGALLLTNSKPSGEAKVRLRFLDEIWDLALAEPGTQVGVALWGRQVAPYGSGEGPQIELFALVLKGQASARIRFVEYRDLTSTPQPTVLTWDNKGPGVQGPIPARDWFTQGLVSLWGKPAASKQAVDFSIALNELNLRLGKPQPTETALAEALQATEGVSPQQRILAVRCLAALDAIRDLLNALEDEQKPPEVREETIHALRHWIGRSDDRERLLFDAKQRTGLLTERRYSPTEAETFLSLLHTFTREQREMPETYSLLIDNLRHDRLSIRELAFWHLRRMVPAGQSIRYDPAGSSEQRERAFEQWKKLVPDGKLPPQPPQPPQPPMPPR